MKILKSAVLAVFVAVVFSGVVISKDDKHEHEEKAETKTGTVSGTVIDIPCHLLKHGPGHSVCALDQGLPVGILDEKGHIWIAITDKFSAANELLAPLMGRKVKAEGWYVETDDLSLIAISKIETTDKEEKK